MRLKEKVAVILRNYPETRNSDKVLVEVYWKVWDKDYIQSNEYGEWVLLNNLIRMTNPNTVIRARQKFNENGEYLPDDEVVIARRKIEKKVRNSIPHGILDYLPE
jgi:hypothetical protein